MNNKDAVIKEIRTAFAQNQYPGDRFLQGSFDGSEPYETVKPFFGQDNWQTIEPELLDTADALNFFSEAALRFFLPAYLIADLRDQFQTADPLFTLTHGFSDLSIEIPTKSGVFVRKTGKSTFINPRRYGGMTFYDYARWRLSVFTREEAKAIVVYLTYKRDTDSHSIHRETIDAALDLFWLEQAEHAPTAEELAQHLKDEEAFLAAIG